MADRGYEHRKKWNAANYKQLNVALPPDLAEAFKAACEAHGESVRQVLVKLVSEYASAPPPKRRAATAPDYGTRAKRKKAALAMLEQLEDLHAAEEEYKDSIPESMYNRRDEAENAVTAYEDAIAAMEGIYAG